MWRLYRIRAPGPGMPRQCGRPARDAARHRRTVRSRSGARTVAYSYLSATTGRAARGRVARCAVQPAPTEAAIRLATSSLPGLKEICAPQMPPLTGTPT